MELESIKKISAALYTRELRKVLYLDPPELSVSRECALLRLPRSTFYDHPVALRQSMVRIMARIEAFYLEDPCRGSRRVVVYLASVGFPQSAVNKCETSFPIGVYTRTTKNLVPLFQKLPLNSFSQW